MIISVTEECLTEDNTYALRRFDYECDAIKLLDAFIELESNFDPDNIVANSSHDEFEGECLESEVVKVEVKEWE